MSAGIDAARSVNTGAFSFPANKAITVANDGIYEAPWYMYYFSAWPRAHHSHGATLTTRTTPI